MVHLLFIICGLAGLWLATRLVIDGALGLSAKYRLSHSFAGLVILAVGTDLPEVFVTVDAAILDLKGIESSGIVAGNAIGSSISQITLVLGISGLFLNFSMPARDWFRNSVALLASIALLFLFGLDGIVSRTEGAAMITCYGIYFFALLKNKSAPDGEQHTDSRHPAPVLILFLMAGFTILIFSSHLAVRNAMALAVDLNIAQSFVGILILGLGTSLPELAVSLSAAFRKSAGLSIGNIVGSNIFDGFIPIGLGSVISTTAVERSLLRFDLLVLSVMTLAVVLFLKTKKGISKPESISLIIFYLLYVALKIISGS